MQVARELREVHQFRGYIHLKTIPDADPALIAQAGRYADRLSVNIELPTQDSVQKLAPEKSVHTIKLAMGAIRRKLDEKAEEPRSPRFAPAGQSTQMIVGTYLAQWTLGGQPISPVVSAAYARRREPAAGIRGNNC